MKKINYKKGYTLLFSVLVATLVLGIAVFIVNISRKQYILASSARDSIYAFYAADSALECFSIWPAGTSTQTVSCGTTGSAQLDFVQTSDLPFTSPYDTGSTIYVSLNNSIVLPNNTCAIVSIWSGYKGINNITVVEARGYSACESGLPSISPRTVERALRYVI